MDIFSRLMGVFLSVISIFLTMTGQPGYPSQNKVDMDKFELTWSDEFDGDEVDYNTWNAGWWGKDNTFVRKGGYWNNKMASVEDGCLHIGTRYYKNGINNDGKAGWYSTQLTTEHSFNQAYGYFEVRCILPKGLGIWSAFWMMNEGVFDVNGNGKDGTEIDIFESPFYESSKNRDVVSSTLHYDGYGSSHKSKVVSRTHVYGNDPYENFNTYGLEWNKDGYTFYINGQVCGKSNFGGVSRNPEYILLSVEVGGENGVPGESWVGPSIEKNSEPPTDFIVDYVRAYQYK